MHVALKLVFGGKEFGGMKRSRAVLTLIEACALLEFTNNSVCPTLVSSINCRCIQWIKGPTSLRILSAELEETKIFSSCKCF